MDLLEKPFNRAELLAVLHRNLARSNRQVLIVDDDADARNLIAGYVAEDGADIRTAANGREVRC